MKKIIAGLFTLSIFASAAMGAYDQKNPGGLMSDAEVMREQRGLSNKWDKAFLQNSHSTDYSYGKNFGVEVGTKLMNGNSRKFLGIQELGEIVGEGSSSENFINLFYKHNFTQVGVRYSNNSDLDENKYEMTWKFFTDNLSSKEYGIGTYLNGGIGWGIQAGKEKVISTRVTNIAYITTADLSRLIGPTRAYIDDSSYLTYSIGLGVEFKPIENLFISAGYELERKVWDIKYNVGSPNGGKTELSGEHQDFHGIRFSLAYLF